MQGIVLVTFPAACTIFTDTSEYGLSSTQQASLYRKLETSSRSQAVTRARQLGLLEG